MHAIQVTVLELSNLKKIGKRSTLLLLDKNGGTSKAVARELARLGFRKRLRHLRGLQRCAPVVERQLVHAVQDLSLACAAGCCSSRMFSRPSAGQCPLIMAREVAHIWEHKTRAGMSAINSPRQ